MICQRFTNAVGVLWTDPEVLTTSTSKVVWLPLCYYVLRKSFFLLLSFISLARNSNLAIFQICSKYSSEIFQTVFLKWIGAHGILRGNIYVVGCTNAGKSYAINLIPK